MKIALIAIVAVVILGGAYYMFSQSQETDNNITLNANQNTNISNENDNDEDLTENRTTIARLMASGEPMRCEYEEETEEGLQEGEIYLDTENERMRGNFTIEGSGNETLKMYVIKDSEWLYSWDASENGQGTKINISEQTEVNGQLEENQTYDEDKEIDFRCRSWQVDASLFVVPSDVEFIDFSQALEANSEVGAEINCAACAQAPDEESKASCLVALGCN